MIHVFQVHKESIDCVPHAKKGRDSFELEIFGMVGVPQELVQERLIKIYGEPAAKKQKIDHMPGVLLPGSGAAPQGMWTQPGPHPHGGPQGRGMMPGMPGRGFHPHHQGGFMPGRGGFMPPGRGGFGMHHGPPGPLNPGPGFMPPHHGRGMPPYQQHPPQGRGFAPPPHQYAPQRPGMMPAGMMAPHIQQQPISAAAKAEVVERADHLIQQSTISKKATKKKIIRVYDHPGFSMEEIRAGATKYSRFIANPV